MTTTHPVDDALVVDGVSGGYRDTMVLRDVSMRVPRGSVVALMGANGAGKTTLINVISGLVPATTGSITVAGVDVTRTPPNRRVRHGLCHVPEGRGIFRSLTVRENLVLQAGRGTEDQALERVTEAFPVLGQRLGQQAGTLSGGEQQMLAMGSAYLRDPQLVLVDEPSLGLAPKVVDLIYAFLAEMAARGASLLVVDHVPQAMAMASSVYVLRRGEVVYDGTQRQLEDEDLLSHYLGDLDPVGQR